MEVLCMNNYGMSILFIPKSLIQVWLNLYIFVQTDFDSAFNDVTVSLLGDVTETLPFQKC